MQYQVLVENVADEMFSATVIGVPDCVAEGTTEEEALNNATRMLKARLAKGDLFNIEVPGVPSPVTANPWLEVHGSLRNDPSFDDFVTEISSYRQENDAGESEQ
jgi:predicted RNase H-like HicB family nuclease